VRYWINQQTFLIDKIVTRYNSQVLIEEQRSEYRRANSFVDFLHPWGGHWTNFGVLLAMLFGLLGATGIALRSQDIG
jgi:hypothetical protein